MSVKKLVSFNNYSFSKHYDDTSFSSDISSIESCIEPTKLFDGYSKDIYDTYAIIGAFFNVGKVDVKKIGKSYDDIQYIQDIYKKFIDKNNTVPWSIFLLKNIISKKMEYRIFGSIKNASDVLSITNDEFIIQNCIDMLKRTIENLAKKKVEKMKFNISNNESEDELDEDEKKLRNIWEKTCGRSSCINNYHNCCWDKRTIKKINYNASILRSGCRDYASSLEIEHSKFIEKLITILEEAIILIKNKPQPENTSPIKFNIEILTV